MTIPLPIGGERAWQRSDRRAEGSGVQMCVSCTGIPGLNLMGGGQLRLRAPGQSLGAIWGTERKCRAHIAAPASVVGLRHQMHRLFILLSLSHSRVFYQVTTPSLSSVAEAKCRNPMRSAVCPLPRARSPFLRGPSLSLLHNSPHITTSLG